MPTETPEVTEPIVLDAVPGPDGVPTVDVSTLAEALPPGNDAPPPPRPPTSEPEREPDPLVAIHRIVDPQGNIKTEVQFQGDIRPTEVETLIKLGLAAWQRQIGV